MSPDSPNKFVYDTEFAENAARNYQPQIQLLKELCAYGSNLLLRCFRERDNKLEDAILIGCLLRQFLTHLDAAHVLVSKGCGDAALIHLRAMLEEEIYLNWLLKEQTPLRTKHFYVWNLRKRKRANLVADPTTDEAKGAKATVGSQFEGVITTLQTPEMQSACTRENAKIDSILADADLAKADRAFEALRKGRPHDVKWHEPFGVKSVAAMARDVNMSAQYRFFYSKWSELMHSSGFFDHIWVDDKGASVEQVRDVEKIAEAIRMAVSIAQGVFRLFINRYRPGEIESFRRKYLTEWRDRAMNIPKVRIDRKDADR